MLAKFTEVAKVDGQIYARDRCNNNQKKASAMPVVYTEAAKCFLISKLLNVLRLHLRRFTWSGRSNHGKISVHVESETQLEVHRYCSSDLKGRRRQLYVQSVGCSDASWPLHILLLE